ncbi:MAG: type 1 fimbrial protein [Providencia sp.]|nr:type 1 fimbrial protein [Providencia sp.]
MSAYQRFIVQAIFILICSYAHAYEVGMRHEGITQLVGSVISTPCSITMKDKNQLIDFSSLTMNMLSTQVKRDQFTQPFEIELRGCGSVYSSIDSKTWSILFDGTRAEHVTAFMLQGPSYGLGVSILDDTNQPLVPGQMYSLFNNKLQEDNSRGIFLLRYFLRLELTGVSIQAGAYHGVVHFFIDYQ